MTLATLQSMSHTLWLMASMYRLHVWTLPSMSWKRVINILNKQRINMKFLFKLCKNLTRMFEMLKWVYGEDIMSRAHVFEWCSFLKEGMKLSLTANLDIWHQIQMETSKSRELWHRMINVMLSEWLQKNWRSVERLYDWFQLKNWGWRKFVLRWCPRTSLSSKEFLLKKSIVVMEHTFTCQILLHVTSSSSIPWRILWEDFILTSWKGLGRLFWPF